MTTTTIDQCDILMLQVDIPSAGVVIFAVSGDIDLSTSARLESSARYYLAGYRPRELTLDLSAVRFFGAAGVTALLRIDDAAREATTSLLLVAGPKVLHPLSILGLQERFTITVAPPQGDTQRVKSVPIPFALAGQSAAVGHATSSRNRCSPNIARDGCDGAAALSDHDRE